MTFYEYDLRMRAFELQAIDEEYRIHRQAWANREVKAEKKSGKNKKKPVYTKFKDFFDYEKMENLVRNKKNGNKKPMPDRFKGVIRYMERMKKGGKL